MTRPTPNRKPFPRRYFVERLHQVAEVHQLLRNGHEEYFRTRNPEGWRHDLGAQDVFLDNAGLVFQEQVGRALWDRHMHDLKSLMLRWERLREEVVPGSPWWGTHFNASGRSANAGEPRGLLRFMRDLDLKELDNEEYSPDHLNDRFGPGRLTDWVPDDLVDGEYWWESRNDQSSFSGGVPLPAAWSASVDRVRILPPSAATPDLPLRSGYRKVDQAIYRNALRDQGKLGTCVAQAVASALEIAGSRARPRKWKPAHRFSAAWLHTSTGSSRRDGRSLGSIARFVDRGQLCSDALFAYPEHPGKLQQWAADHWVPDSGAVAKDHTQLADYWGEVEVRNLQPADTELDVAKVKAHLAAGWVVVVAASLPQVVYDSPGLNVFGSVVNAPLGSLRHAQGHAWTLIGYDHIDGNVQWKYQGHFLAMTSWGSNFPAKQPLGPGIVAVPFSFFLSEGYEAWAFRFRT